MPLAVVLFIVVPVAAAFGWFVLGPVMTGHPPFVGPTFTAYVNVWCPELRRLWPPYTAQEKRHVREVRAARLGPFA